MDASHIYPIAFGLPATVPCPFSLRPVCMRVCVYVCMRVCAYVRGVFGYPGYPFGRVLDGLYMPFGYFLVDFLDPGTTPGPILGPG